MVGILAAVFETIVLELRYSPTGLWRWWTKVVPVPEGLVADPPLSISWIAFWGGVLGVCCWPRKSLAQPGAIFQFSSL
jgi:hypothetical protein